MIISYLLSALLCLTGAFLIWFFIYGRKDLIGKETGVISRLVLPGVLAFFTSLIISFDFNSSLSYLEVYAEGYDMSLIFLPGSAFIMVFLLIPSCVSISKKGATVSENEAIIAPFLFMLTLNFLCLTIIRQNAHIYASMAFFTTGLLCMLVTVSTPLISQDRYNKGILKINEQLSSSRNAHYEALKESNFEIRRTRHDMKNHLLVIKDLASRKMYDELNSYINTITEKIENADPLYRSGNDIADMIIADKSAKASKRGLALKVTGDLAGLVIEPSDLVTILSNLLDNAIEAVNRLYGSSIKEDDKVIELEFRKNANFLFIIERNMSGEKVFTDSIRSSKNSPDHGFGIYNIRKTVAKYGGEYTLECVPSGALYRVEAQIILPKASE